MAGRNPIFGGGTARERIDRATQRGHDAYDSDPPPSGDLAKVVVKRLAPWVTIGTLLASGAGYVYSAGRSREEIATKDYVDKATSANIEVQRQHEAEFKQIEIALGQLSTEIKSQSNAIGEVKADMKELRGRAGVIVTGGHHP